MEVPLPLAPSLARRRLQVYLALLLSDGLAILAGFSLAGFLYFGEWLNRAAMLQAQLIIPLYWTFAIAQNAYAADAALDAGKGVVRSAWSLLYGVAAALLAVYLLKASKDFSRFISASGALLSLFLIALGRDQWMRFARWRCGETANNLLLITDGCERIPLPHGYHIEARDHGMVPDIRDPGAMHRIAHLVTNMDCVLVRCEPEKRAAWGLVLKAAGVRSEIIYDDVSALGAVGAHSIPDYGGLVVAVGPLGLRNRILKRGFDLVVAAAALIALAPLLLCVALAIKVDDGGPVLFVQQRSGRNNRLFPIYKFRSMREASADPVGASLVARNDGRITRVGRFIRATSIDELPQLINVIKGEMSLVGPRPHALASRAGGKLYWEIDLSYWQRHSLKPGMTGLAQVRGLRGGTDLETDLVDRLQADLEYLDGWTLWRDIALIFATASVVVHRNAY